MISDQKGKSMQNRLLFICLCVIGFVAVNLSCNCKGGIMDPGLELHIESIDNAYSGSGSFFIKYIFINKSQKNLDLFDFPEEGILNNDTYGIIIEPVNPVAVKINPVIVNKAYFLDNQIYGHYRITLKPGEKFEKNLNIFVNNNYSDQLRVGEKYVLTGFYRNRHNFEKYGYKFVKKKIVSCNSIVIEIKKSQFSDDVGQNR